MIVLSHENYLVSEIIGDLAEIKKQQYYGKSLADILYMVAHNNPKELLIWVNKEYSNFVDLNYIAERFHHPNFIFSYNQYSFFDSRLGYIEDTPYVVIDKSVRYATWQMSSLVGAIHASVLLEFKDIVSPEPNFDYFITSLAKLGMPKGLFCYSDPKLLLDAPIKTVSNKAQVYDLFRFTKQHYKFRWVLILFACLFLYEKRITLLPMFFSLFYKRRKADRLQLSEVTGEVSTSKRTVDVLIPTIGRKEYLREVLKMLSKQTYFPSRVIIVEQNPIPESSTELDFLSEPWPFEIVHHFTHNTGACQARNIGLNEVKSDVLFMADDDIVFDEFLIENAMQMFDRYQFDAFLVNCHLKTQNFPVELPKQFAVFGAGHAFVKKEALATLKFNTAYEFGFGEDNDFGMQMRYRGYDIHYVSHFKILHLKAPVGGFRTKPILKWSKEKNQPKPSPTVMLFRLMHTSKEQLRCYKLLLFTRNFKGKKLLTPFQYFSEFRLKWNVSVFWAQKLRNKSS